MIKREFRKKFEEERNAMPLEEIDNKSKSIVKILLGTKEYKKAKRIFTFVNANSEPVTIPLIEQAWKDGKVVAVPKMTGKPHEMVFVEIKSMEELKPNKYGIREPELIEGKVVLSDKDTIMIVPALAIDKEGYRLGYGGGYYDKYISENDSMANIGIAFNWQIVNKVPVNENDMKLDMVVTEEGRVK